jgi:hypothetical protein
LSVCGFRRLLGVCLAVSTAACTLVAPLGGLTSGSSSQEQAEGGGSGTGPTDAGGDVAPDVTNSMDSPGESPADAPSPVDKGGPPPPTDGPSDTSALTFCEKASHFFCADFDEGSVDAGWSVVQAGNAGDLALDTQTYTSAPASAQLGGDQNASAALTKYLSPTVPGQVHVELDVIGCAVPSAGVVSLVNIGQDMPGNSSENVLRVQSDGTTVFIADQYPGDGGEVYNRYTLPSGLSTTSWTHVVLDVVLSETDGSVSLSLGGSQVLSVSGIPTSSANVTDTYVAVEARTFQVTAAETALFDSVTVDLP